MAKKNPLQHGLYSLWYVKIDHSQNQYLSTSLERPYKELLNACFNFEIRCFELQLWATKKGLKMAKKNPLQYGL